MNPVSKKKSSKAGGDFKLAVMAPLLVFVSAAVIYGMYGFDGPLYRDYGIYLYGGQLMASGVPPYEAIFDHKGPLPVALAGFGVVLSGWIGADDTQTVRAVFFVVGCLSAVAVYLLGRVVSRSRAAGFLAALTFIGFQGYSVSVGSGPEPKTPLVLFQALCLALIIRKNWLLAGLCGALAFLTWQPTGILLAVGFVLAVFRPRVERFAAMLRFSVGAATPLVATLAYYLYHGALKQLYEGFLAFNLFRVSRAGEQPFQNLQRIIQPVVSGYDFMVLPAVIGLVALLIMCVLRFRDHRFLPLLLSLPLFAAWSLKDFQVPEDFYVFLTYASVGFGILLALIAGYLGDRLKGSSRIPSGNHFGAGAMTVVFAALLLGGAVVGGPLVDEDATPGPRLSEQERSARQIEARFGENARVVSINAPQVLALMHTENPNPYLFITDGVDRQIAATYPGGFEGWVGDLKDYDPVAIAFFADAQRQMPGADLTPENHSQLYAWLDAGYTPEKIGNFWLYVKD